MKTIRTFFACLACRLTRAALHLLGRGGTAVPGKAALRLYPGLLKELGKRVDTVLVTGTNGKSTTVGMLRHMLDKTGIPYFSNPSGANVISGIATDYVNSSSLFGKPKAPLAVIECDEGHLAAVAAALQPKAIVVTNLFQDQVDRLGGAEHTRDLILDGIARAENAVLCLNADCSLTASLGLRSKHRAVYFGTGEGVGLGDEEESFACPVCGKPLAYRRRVYAHLGEWYCPDCGAARPAPEFLISAYQAAPEGGSSLTMETPEGALPLHLALPALYNAYNAAAAISCAHVMGWGTADCAAALADFGAVFGRMETMTVGETPVQIILVKNPAGFNRALEHIATEPRDFLPIFCLNDNTGDGKDISWIRDVRFEKFLTMHDFAAIGVYGTRAAELKDRLGEAGAAEDRVTVYASADELGDAVKAAGKPVYVLPNYTAMLTVRDKLSVLAGGGKFWE